jgi:hypothetical protein
MDGITEDASLSQEQSTAGPQKLRWGFMHLPFPVGPLAEMPLTGDDQIPFALSRAVGV